MKIITSVCFGFVLAVSTFALASAPASAFETPALTVTAPSNVVRVDDREEFRGHEERREHEERERREREAREHHERCEHARRECRERHGDRDREFRECIERRGC